ncbi:flavodoxin domain-containing protein [Aeromicrobium terrae]|jgi:menaquinone-dependent protoporphyrinogen oxidase|uniref:Protoporphyrinogen oxidase n=1 Tax=Aeromicrobium terrae TaxID=2498846 RepID=A0A5C8NGM8_9ACTN|nr:flavodoxin domain-containing protein [Aeromicrobium terrae]TXL57494.1 protoporphyrinogen oxidase [Aeromicrobium terrae]
MGTTDTPAETYTSVEVHRSRIVVAAASRHGATAEIADRIATRLRTDLPSWSVVHADVLDWPTIDDADVVILGSAIYLGRWLRPAREALDRLDPSMEIWLFSSGPISGVAGEDRDLITADRRVKPLGVRDHAVFGGRLDSRLLSFWERWIARAARAPEGDLRDWAAIDAWADSIAQELDAAVTKDKS